MLSVHNTHVHISNGQYNAYVKMMPCLAIWSSRTVFSSVHPRAGDLLRPDDVTFAVLVRGYGEAVPPQWTAISGLLGMMDSRFQLKPSTGKPSRFPLPLPSSPPTHEC